MTKFLILAILTYTSAYGFDWKKFFSRDLKPSLASGAGIIDLKEKNDFNSSLKFTYLYLSAGLSYTHKSKYRFSARTSLKQYTKLEFEHNGARGSKSIGSVYNDLYFSAARRYDRYIMTLGYDNLNYFTGESSNIIKPIRIDRASLMASCVKFDKFTPSFKLGTFIPVAENVKGFDYNLSGSYILNRKRNLLLTSYIYGATMTVNKRESETTSYGLGLVYIF